MVILCNKRENCVGDGCCVIRVEYVICVVFNFNYCFLKCEVSCGVMMFVK